MNILVANLGSTSFKYRLYDLGGGHEKLLARGSVERIGSPQAKITLHSPKGEIERVEPIADHAAALQICFDQLTDKDLGVISSPADVAAVGFKAVHARNLTGVHRVTEAVLQAMEAYADVTPAHNPPYTRAMRILSERFPALPLVAAFETGFHRTIPESLQRYAVPDSWATQFGIRRWGFHGASHAYIAGRMAELLGRTAVKLISCHLGGSSSLCAIRDGKSVACSLGMSPQSGLPHNNRVGDFDVFALPVVLRETGMSVEQILGVLATQSGLEGISGTGRDLRDIEAAAAAGNTKAALAIDVFTNAVRHYLGAYLVELAGADAIVFTGGIGENSSRIRTGVCRDLDWFGISLDESKNKIARGEQCISAASSRVQVWTVPTNEELVVARHTRALLLAEKNQGSAS
ncbi:MAG TPA: acetate/propionate family kinase [Isosphaeraceae bacterium]|nr:acetate/propionate family kinase [Isosphaeraceae bacterium]